MRSLFLAALLCVCQLVGAQTAPPPTTIRIIVPAPPGGGVDATTRLIAERLTRIWNIPFVVENRTGANAIVGIGVFKTRSDPYTFLVVDIGAAVVNPNLVKNLPYEPRKDFVPVTDLFTTTFFLVARPDRYDSLAKLIAAARAHPGKLNYGGTGAGSGPRLSLELLKAQAGLDISYIPYKGNPQAMVALLGGEVDVASAGLPSVRTYLENGQLAGLATTGATRSPVMPQVPTVAEAAQLKGFYADTWVGLYANPKTPPEVVKRLQEDIARLKDDPEVMDFYRKNDYEFGGSPSEEFARRMETDREKYRLLIQSARITVE